MGGCLFFSADSFNVGANGIVFPRIFGFMSEVRGRDGWSIENGEYAVDNVLYPFAKSLVLVISLSVVKGFSKEVVKKENPF